MPDSTMVPIPSSRTRRASDGVVIGVEAHLLPVDSSLGMMAAVSRLLASVRRCGGVLEHPQGSQAWRAFGLLAPPKSGGWVPAGDGLGYTCCVSQGWYGHLAQKPTWLYAVRCELPPLIWGRAPDHWKNDPTRSERWRARAEKEGVTILLSRKQRAATPLPFRDLLLEIARTVR